VTVSFLSLRNSKWPFPIDEDGEIIWIGLLRSVDEIWKLPKDTFYGEIQFGNNVFPYARYEINEEKYDKPFEFIAALRNGGLREVGARVQLGDIEAQGEDPTEGNILIPVYGCNIRGGQVAMEFGDKEEYSKKMLM